MKSIKEKADGYVSGFHPSIKRMCKESFGDGANYVLEQIEQLIYEKHVEGNLPLFDLTKMIEKLHEQNIL